MNRLSGKASPIILLVPFAVIALALGIGIGLNRQKPKRILIQDLKPVAPRIGSGLFPGKRESGTTEPRHADGSAIFFGDTPDADSLVAWSSIQFVGPTEDFKQAKGYQTSTLSDESGTPWSFMQGWDGQTLYVGIPRGYSKLPKKLTWKIQLAGMDFSSFDLPKLPDPKPLPHPPLVPAWKGLVVQPCYYENSNPKLNQFYIDAPLARGYILAAAFDGTTYSKEVTNYYCGVKGPDALTYDQRCLFSLNHPDADAKAYVEVVEFAPLHFHKQFHFIGMPFKDLFGTPWLTGPSQPVEIAKGVYARINGTDKVPYRAPSKGRHNVILTFETSGLIRHVKAKLLKPTSALSIPISLRPGPSFSEGEVSMTASRADWSSGSPDFVVDIEADGYKMTRHATVEVDMSKTKSFKTTSKPRAAGYRFLKDNQMRFFSPTAKPGGVRGGISAIPAHPLLSGISTATPTH